MADDSDLAPNLIMTLRGRVNSDFTKLETSKFKNPQL